VSGIHHFVPVLHRGDAVGRHTVRLRDATRARGFRSEIYVDMVDAETADQTLSVLSYPDAAEKGDVLVYQLATASVMAPWLAARPEALVVNYHNVTPPELMAPWNNYLARGQLQAQGDLRLLAPRAALAVADSAYNEAELRQAGFARTAVVPPAAMLPAAVGSATSRRTPPPSGARWLFVGRLAPNKAIEDAVAALLVARRHHDPSATLEVVGRPVVSTYADALRRYVDGLGLHDAVHFRGVLSDAEVAASLAGADVLVVTSRHEGFGVPVLEAMASRLPVVANDAGALPEVVGDAGLLIDAGDPYAVASAVERIVRDEDLRERLAQAAARRLEELDLGSASERAADLVVRVLGGEPG